MTGSVLFYVQHLLGVGHLRRALHLVGAMTAAGLRVTLVSGGEPSPELAGAAAERIVQLPSIRTRDARFKEFVDAEGRTVDDTLRQARRDALIAAFAAARPDAVIIEAFPFGRRAFRFELDPLIAMARRRRPAPILLCSIRDIVVAPADIDRQRETIDRVRADFDAVLVHGDPTFIPLDASFPLAAEIVDRLIYTGYVGAPRTPASQNRAGIDEVLVSAGGGAVGGILLATALEARRQGCLAGLRWRLLAGPNLPAAEFASLAGRLPDGVVLERYRADFPQMLRHCRVSVSQAGYNTVLDILAAGAAAVVVPFALEHETEQTLRAEKLAARGVLQMVAEQDLTPDRLARAIDRAAAAAPGALAVDTAGAVRTAHLVADMIRRRAGDVADFVTSPNDYMIEK